MPAPSVRSKSTFQAAAGDFTIVEPTGAAENDILLIVAEFDPNTAYVPPGYDPPSGWTLLYEHVNWTDNSHAWAAWIRRGASAPDLALNRSADPPDGSINHMIFTVLAIQDVDPDIADPFFDVTHTYRAGGKSTVVHPSITNPYSNSLILFALSAYGRDYRYTNGANAALDNFTIEVDDETNWGTDGAVVVNSATMREAGETGDTTFSTLDPNVQNNGTWHQTFGIVGSVSEVGWIEAEDQGAHTGWQVPYNNANLHGGAGVWDSAGSATPFSFPVRVASGKVASIDLWVPTFATGVADHQIWYDSETPVTFSNYSGSTVWQANVKTIEVPEGDHTVYVLTGSAQLFIDGIEITSIDDVPADPPGGGGGQKGSLVSLYYN